MEIDLKTLQPRHEFNRLVLNAKSITINGYSGPVTVTDDGLGNVSVTGAKPDLAARGQVQVGTVKKRGRK